MKIHKVEEKPMVIHTKKKARIHRVEENRKRGRRKVSARKSTPKVKETVRVKKSGRLRPKMQPLRNAGAKENPADAKGVSRNTTKPVDVKGVSRNTPKKAEVTREKQLDVGVIKSEAKKIASTRHNTGIKELGMAGAKTATDQLEGGEELQQATMVAYELARPVYGTVEKSSDFMKQELLAQRKRRLKVVDTPKTTVKQTTIKQVNSQATKAAAKSTAKTTAKETSKKVAKESSKKVAKESTKKAAKETSKAAAKVAAKTATKVATTTATTAAGTALAPGLGTAIGIAAGKMVGVAIDKKDMKVTNRNRKIKYFMDKMNSEEKQSDNLLKLAKDLIVKRVKTKIKTAGPILVIVLGIMAFSISLVAVPVVASIGILYNSPFAIFLPPLEPGDTVMSVTRSYESDFFREVNTLASEHVGYDNGYLVYAGPTSNYYDMMSVYMVKYGVGDTATIMKDRAKRRLATVVDDMCDYFTASTSYKYTEIVDEEEVEYVVTTLYVYVTLKDYRDMIYEYDFDEDEVELLESLMDPENIGRLQGY